VIKILKAQLSTALIYIKKLSHEKHVAFNEIKKFSLGPNIENLDEFLNLLREYKNICGKVRSIKFSIKSKQFHQSIESACNDFRNKNVRSAWLKIKEAISPYVL
jgi:predicted metal-binding protein